KTLRFDTTVGRLMFADQFLQLSTKLSSEYVYGFGEHMHESFKHDLNWKTFGMFSRDEGPNKNLYGVHPFHMCMEGDGNAHGVLFLNSNAQDVTLQPMPALTYRSVGGLMDFYIFTGPSPEAVVSQYTETIGRPYMPPMWALGFQLCRYGYGSLDKLKKVVDRMLDTEIPYDVQYTDIDYMDRQLDFTINSTTYNGLEDFARDIKNNHKMKYIIIFDPAISGNETAGTYSPFDLGKQQDVFIKTPDGQIAFGKVWPDLPGIYVNTSWGWDDQTKVSYKRNMTDSLLSPITVLFKKITSLVGKVMFVPNVYCGSYLLIVYLVHLVCFFNVTVSKHHQFDTTQTFRAHTAFPDYFKPITQQWWSDLIVEFYKRLEFDGLWIDMNEPASFVHGSVDGTCPNTKWDNPLPYHPGILGTNLYEKTTCMSNQQFNPQTGNLDFHYNMHSLYGWSQSKTTLEACRASTGERCMVISRSTFPGSGKYSGHWLGDNSSLWSHLAASIIGMLEFNLFGIPYVGADICGFFGDTNEELCLRWMQLGAFYPFGRNHNGLGFRDQDPAAFSPRYIWIFVAASKKVLEIRYQILPYFYTLFYDAHTTGSTVVRSLMAEKYFQLDLTTYNIDKQMLLGRSILISPVLEPGVDSVNAYVPDDKWYDYYTGSELASGLRKTFTFFNAPLDHIPIHIRGGSIIPIQTPARTTELQRDNPLGLIYAIGETSTSATGHLFWDDWSSIDDFENGGTYRHIAHVVINTQIFSPVIVKRHCFKVIFSSGVALHLQKLFLQNPKVSFDEQDVLFEDGALSDLASKHQLFEPYYALWYYLTILCCISKTILQIFVIVLPFFCTHFFYRSQIKYHLFFKRLKFMLQISGLNLQLTSSWQIIWDTNQYAERFNCHPEQSIRATRTACLSRGCFFDEVSIPGVPPCYYPHNYGAYYKDTAPSDTTEGILKTYFYLYGQLKYAHLPKPSFFNQPVQRLKVEVEEHSEYQLRIKISDAVNSRYEVPLTLSGKKHGKPSDALYEVIYQDNPFAFKVVRRATREVIMDTSVGALIFEDQFIQLSTKTATTHLYGLGEAEHKNYKHDFFWTRQGLHARDEGVKQNANLYGYHPFHITMEREGNAHGVLLLTSNAMEVDLTPLPSITYRTIGGILDFYLFMGPTPEQVIQQYSLAIGTPMMPPYWALGFQLCKYGYGNIGELKTVVEEMRNYEIPFDVQYGDIDYMDRQLDFTIDPVNYAGLSDYVDKLRDDYKMRYVVILDPAISANESDPYPPFDGGITADIFIRSHDGELAYGLVWPDLPGTLWENSTLETRAHVVFPDYFNPITKDWWSDNIIEFHKQLTLTTGADICGFFEDAEEEMCLRWSQLGAFYPFSRNHAMLGVRRQDPAAWGPQFAASVKKVLKTRYTLLPYLYTLFHHSHTSGSSVVRPLMHEFTNDENTWELDGQFLWGHALLVSPVLDQGATSVEAYIPDARWFDYYSGGEVPERKAKVVLQAPLDHINLHVRGGYIIPTQSPAVTTYFSRQNDFGLLVLLDDDMKSSGNLFWDDGDSLDTVKNKLYTYSTFTCE
uniref:alpha-glucosidase n=1 Tax=Ciona savignyi TaxID=51511 RepID=H2ZBD9_CIOSA